MILQSTMQFLQLARCSCTSSYVPFWQHQQLQSVLRTASHHWHPGTQHQHVHSFSGATQRHVHLWRRGSGMYLVLLRLQLWLSGPHQLASTASHPFSWLPQLLPKLQPPICTDQITEFTTTTYQQWHQAPRPPTVAPFLSQAVMLARAHAHIYTQAHSPLRAPDRSTSRGMEMQRADVPPVYPGPRGFAPAMPWRTLRV